MQNFYANIVSLLLAVKGISASTKLWNFLEEETPNFSQNHLRDLLSEIYKERPYNGLLVLQENVWLHGVFDVDLPKIINVGRHIFVFKEHFNSDIVAVFLMRGRINKDLMAQGARILNHMRQVRVVIFMEDSRREEELEVKEEVLKISGKYKMTNVLLGFGGHIFYQLKPYPEYHWLPRSLADNLPYFPPHWRNMSQKHILTYTDQTAPRTVITAVDATTPQQGVPKLNGFVARLVLLFAELFNARLEMCCNFHWKNVTPYPVINQMVDREQLDIPMSLDPVLKGNYSYRSQVYDVGKAFLMVPCSEAFSLQEISKMLLNRNFFGYIFICGFLLTALHSLTDYFLDGQFDWRDLLINERILPGVLAQASVARKSPWLVIKITYVLLFLVGLNISAQFSARMNTLFTRPPHHRDIESLQDIEESSMKILLESSEAKTMEKVLKPISKSLVLTNQTARYLQMRRDLNTSYGYAVNTAVWKMLLRKQNYFPHKVFCTSDKLTIFPFIHWTIRLQANSEYKEPLDYLILRVHELGLMKAWHGSTFVDMLRLKQITLANPNAKEEFFILREQDLMWIWVMEMVGLMAAWVVFLLELMWPRVADGRRFIGKCCKILLSKYWHVV